jgi:hypothetical protein
MNPIEIAVAPLKADAVARAETEAHAAIARAHAKLAEFGWDVDKAAPRPNGNMGRAQYKTMMAKHNWLLSLTTHTKSYHRYGEPHIRAASPDQEARYIAASRDGAAQQYDLFVMKLTRKIGECLTATLTGNHVWGRSTLTVTKADGTTERWMTQQIVNVSVLGLIFNQWPTRKVR